MSAVREVLTRAVSAPGDVLRGIGEPISTGMDVLHRSSTLTIFAATWTPRMSLLAHDHEMWALIGIYTGREDNIFWRETENGLEARGANCLFEGDVAILGRDAIHSVTNGIWKHWKSNLPTAIAFAPCLKPKTSGINCVNKNRKRKPRIAKPFRVLEQNSSPSPAPSGNGSI